MTTQRLELTDGVIAFDDSGGDGPLVVMLPGAGDVRAEHLAERCYSVLASNDGIDT